MNGPSKPEVTNAERLLLPGTELGVSDWVTLDETMNQTFADVTLDPVAMEIEIEGVEHPAMVAEWLLAWRK